MLTPLFSRRRPRSSRPMRILTCHVPSPATHPCPPCLDGHRDEPTRASARHGDQQATRISQQRAEETDTFSADYVSGNRFLAFKVNDIRDIQDHWILAIHGASRRNSPLGHQTQRVLSRHGRNSIKQRCEPERQDSSMAKTTRPTTTLTYGSARQSVSANRSARPDGPFEHVPRSWPWSVDGWPATTGGMT